MEHAHILRRVPGYSADIIEHETQDGHKSNFVRLGNPDGLSIWLGTSDGDNFERLPNELADHLEGEFAKLDAKEAA